MRMESILWLNFFAFEGQRRLVALAARSTRQAKAVGETRGAENGADILSFLQQPVVGCE